MIVLVMVFGWFSIVIWFVFMCVIVVLICFVIVFCSVGLIIWFCVVMMNVDGFVCYVVCVIFFEMYLLYYGFWVVVMRCCCVGGRFGVKFCVIVLFDSCVKLFVFLCNLLVYVGVGSFCVMFVIDWLLLGVNVVMYMSDFILLLLFVLLIMMFVYEWLISMIGFFCLLIVCFVVVVLLVSEFSGFCIDIMCSLCVFSSGIMWF